MGLPKDEVHVHSLKLDPECLAEIQAIERATSAPAKHDDPRFAKLGVEWMSAPGYHIGIDDTNSTKSEIVFVVKITYVLLCLYLSLTLIYSKSVGCNANCPQRAYSGELAYIDGLVRMCASHQIQCGESCNMFTSHSFNLTRFQAHKAPQGEIPGSVNRFGQIHGQQEAVDQSAKKPRGKMYGVGWHAAMQKGMTLAYYAPKSSSDNTVQRFLFFPYSFNSNIGLTVYRYEDLLKKLPNVANLYRTRFALLFPGGATEMMKTSAE